MSRWRRHDHAAGRSSEAWICGTKNGPTIEGGHTEHGDVGRRGQGQTCPGLPEICGFLHRVGGTVGREETMDAGARKGI